MIIRSTRLYHAVEGPQSLVKMSCAEEGQPQERDSPRVVRLRSGCEPRQVQHPRTVRGFPGEAYTTPCHKAGRQRLGGFAETVQEGYSRAAASFSVSVGPVQERLLPPRLHPAVG